MKLKRVTTGANQLLGWKHWCAGCERTHVIAVETANSSGARWTFDGNHEAPTFSPSINIRVGPYPTAPAGRPDAGKIDICHYFIRSGSVEFLADCTHPLAGRTVPLPDLPEPTR